MKHPSFALRYLRHPFQVGAIVKSSRHLVNKMLDEIDFSTVRYLVEYGPGSGILLSYAKQRAHPDCRILSIELDDAFYANLAQRYRGDDRITIVHGSAENVREYMRDAGFPRVDAILSGLPFASLPERVSHNILSVTRDLLPAGAPFVTFQYTLLKKGLIGGYFPSIGITRELRNIPPAYVFRCTKI